MKLQQNYHLSSVRPLWRIWSNLSGDSGKVSHNNENLHIHMRTYAAYEIHHRAQNNQMFDVYEIDAHSYVS